jgi:hypothetical protein
VVSLITSSSPFASRDSRTPPSTRHQQVRRRVALAGHHRAGVVGAHLAALDEPVQLLVVSPSNRNSERSSSRVGRHRESSR